MRRPLRSQNNAPPTSVPELVPIRPLGASKRPSLANPSKVVIPRAGDLRKYLTNDPTEDLMEDLTEDLTEHLTHHLRHDLKMSTGSLYLETTLEYCLWRS